MTEVLATVALDERTGVVPALVHWCRSCVGTGTLRIAHYRIPCAGCNGNGFRLQIASVPFIKEWVEAQSTNQ